jgi:hypothetical protein
MTRLFSSLALYRYAALVMLLLAAGHTYGFLNFVAPDPAARAVFEAMHSTRFSVSGESFSYADFYDGFGLTISAEQIFLALLAWHLGNLSRRAPGAIGVLGWAMVALELAGLALAVRYFGLVQVVFFAVLSILLAAAAWRVPTETQGNSSAA